MSILSIKNISKFYALDGKIENKHRNINYQIAEGKSLQLWSVRLWSLDLLNIISGLDREFEESWL